MAWWDDLGETLSNFIDSAKNAYEQFDQNVFGGGLPFGYETPSETPISAGFETAIEQAQDPTVDAPIWEGGHLTSAFGLRDAPVLGGAVRAAEVPLNLWNQMSERVWQPFYGAMEYENPGEVMKRKGGSDWWQEQGAALGESDLGMGRVAKGWKALTGTPEEQEEGRRKFRELSTGQQLFGIATDPTNFIGLPGFAKPTTIKRAAEVAKATKDISELSAWERLIGGVAKGAEDLPLEQMRAGNLLQRSRIPILSQAATLTGKAKAAQDVASMTDQVVGRVGTAIKGIADDGEKIKAASGIISDLLNLTPDAAMRLGKSAKSFESAVTRKVLSGFDPTQIVKKYEEGQAVQKALADIKAGTKVVGADELAKLQKRAKDLPANVDEAMSQFARDMVEHANKVTRKAYGVSEKDQGIDKLIAMQKNILSSALLAMNPNYPVTNAVSNFALTLLSGYSPFRTAGGAEKVAKGAGLIVQGAKKGEPSFAPSRMFAKMGQADVEAKGWQKISAMGLAQWLEKVQGEGLWTQAFERYFRQGLNKVLPQDVLGPQVRAALNQIDPRMAGWVEDIVRNGADTPAEAIKKINQLPGMDPKGGRPVLAILLPDELKSDPGLRAALSKAGLNRFEAELANAQSFEEVQSIIGAFKQRIAEQVKNVDDAAKGIATPQAAQAATVRDIVTRSDVTGASYRMATGDSQKAKLLEAHPEAQSIRLMSPQDYLDIVRKEQGMSFTSSGMAKRDVINQLKDRMRKGEPIDAAYLDVDVNNGRVITQEGRHRAQAAAELGIDEIPVIVFTKDAKGFVPAAGNENVLRQFGKGIDTTFQEATENEPLGAILDFIKADRDTRSAAMGRGVDIRATGGKYTDVDLADMFDAERSDLEKLVSNFTAKMGGTIEEKYTKALGDSFATWRKMAKDAQDARLAARKKYGSDLNKLNVELASIDGQYTTDMKAVRTKVNRELSGMMKQVVNSTNLPPDQKKLWTEYWQRSFRPQVAEEAEQAAYGQAKLLAKNEAELKAASDAYHPKRQAQWEAENAWLAEREAELRKMMPEKAAPAPQAAPTVAPEPSPYVAGETVRWQELDKALDQIAVKAQEFFATPVQNEVPPDVHKAVINAIWQRSQDFNDAKLAAMRMANADRDFALLNYSHRYNFDHYLSLVYPFAFWQNAMMKNMAVRYMEQPGLFAAYSRYKQMLNEAEDDPTFPDRLRGMLRVSLPGAPEWMGDQFIDPLGRALPFNQMMYPLQAQQWAKEGEQGLGGMAEIIGSKSPLLTIPMNLATGQGKEVGTILPLTRQVKGLTAMAREKFPQLEKQIPAGGLNIEKDVIPLRQGLQKIDPTVPDVDQWDEYRINRMLSDMTSNGEITPAEAKQAMAARSGPIWDRAVQKTGMEMGIGSLPGVAGAMTIKTYPTGEELAKQEDKRLDDLVLRVASEAAGRPVTNTTDAWAIINEKGLDDKGTEIWQWRQDHPANAVRSLATKPDAVRVDEAKKSLAWDELNEGTVPSKWKAANLTKEEQDALQAFYDKKGYVNLTPQEKQLVDSVIAKIDKARETPEFQELARLKTEIDGLIDSEFARLGGPEGVTNKYDWIKQANGGKTTPAIAKWYADHPGYSTTSTSGTGTQSGGSTYRASSSSYKPYSSVGYQNPGGVWSNAWSQLKRYYPTLIKGVGKMFKSGKPDALLVQKLFEAYQAMRITIPFEVWVKRLMQDSGLIE